MKYLLILLVFAGCSEDKFIEIHTTDLEKSLGFKVELLTESNNMLLKMLVKATKNPVCFKYKELENNEPQFWMVRAGTDYMNSFNSYYFSSGFSPKTGEKLNTWVEGGHYEFEHLASYGIPISCKGSEILGKSDLKISKEVWEKAKLTAEEMKALQGPEPLKIGMSKQCEECLFKYWKCKEVLIDPDLGVDREVEEAKCKTNIDKCSKHNACP